MKRMQMANGLYTQQEIEASEHEAQIQLDQLRSSIQQIQAQEFIQPPIETIPHCFVMSHISVLKEMDCRVEDTLAFFPTALQDFSAGVHCDDVISDAPDIDVNNDVVEFKNNVDACRTLDENTVIADVIVDSSVCVIEDKVTAVPVIVNDVVLPELLYISTQTYQPDQKTSETVVASNCDELISTRVVDSWTPPDWTLSLQPKSPINILKKALTTNAIIQLSGWTLFLNRLRSPEKIYEDAMILEEAAQDYSDHMKKVLAFSRSIPLPAWMLHLNCLPSPRRDFFRSTHCLRGSF